MYSAGRDGQLVLYHTSDYGVVRAMEGAVCSDAKLLPNPIAISSDSALLAVLGESLRRRDRLPCLPPAQRCTRTPQHHP